MIQEQSGNSVIQGTLNSSWLSALYRRPHTVTFGATNPRPGCQRFLPRECRWRVMRLRGIRTEWASATRSARGPHGGLQARRCATLWGLKPLRYIELKSGHSANGPAGIAYVVLSKSGRTLYFNGRGLMKLKGQRRGDSGGNHIDMETGESFWISRIKKNGQDRHWAGAGKVLIEAAAVSDYLKTINAKTLDTSRCQITDSIVPTDIERLSKLANTSGKGWLMTRPPGRIRSCAM